MRKSIVPILLIAFTGIAAAGELQDGDKEVAFQVSYSDTDFGSSSGLDLGSRSEMDLSLKYGWLVTANHEFGFVGGYQRIKDDFGDAPPPGLPPGQTTQTTDGTRLGGFYNFNFGRSGIATPYVGLTASKLGGDLGDLYDLQYGLEAGVKVYPFEHGGVIATVGYSRFSADAEGLDDADGVSVGAGILIKY